MDRRQFLSKSAVPLALLGGGSTFVYARTAYARSRRTHDLVEEARPLLATKALEELRTWPDDARERMRVWFHGPCLNAADFCHYVCSDAFVESLSFLPREEKERQVLLEFDRRVVDAGAIRGQVDLVARETATQLDLSWENCLFRIAERWDTRMETGSFRSDALFEGIDEAIRRDLTTARERAIQAGVRTTAREVGGTVARDVLLMLPLRLVLPHVYLPACVAASLLRFAEYVVGRLQNRAANVQREVSARLVELANGVGNDLREEFRTRITLLQDIQERAVRDQAQELAVATIPYF